MVSQGRRTWTNLEGIFSSRMQFKSHWRMCVWTHWMAEKFVDLLVRAGTQSEEEQEWTLWSAGRAVKPHLVSSAWVCSKNETLDLLQPKSLVSLWRRMWGWEKCSMKRTVGDTPGEEVSIIREPVPMESLEHRLSIWRGQQEGDYHPCWSRSVRPWGAVPSGWVAGAKYHQLFSYLRCWSTMLQPETPEEPLPPAMSLQRSLLKKLNILISLTKKCLKQFHPLLQSMYLKVNLEPRDNQLILA